MRLRSPRRRPGSLSLGPPPLILSFPAEMLRRNGLQWSRRYFGSCQTGQSRDQDRGSTEGGFLVENQQTYAAQQSVQHPQGTECTALPTALVVPSEILSFRSSRNKCN